MSEADTQNTDTHVETIDVSENENDEEEDDELIDDDATDDHHKKKSGGKITTLAKRLGFPNREWRNVTMGWELQNKGKKLSDYIEHHAREAWIANHPGDDIKEFNFAKLKKPAPELVAYKETEEWQNLVKAFAEINKAWVDKCDAFKRTRSEDWEAIKADRATRTQEKALRQKNKDSNNDDDNDTNTSRKKRRVDSTSESQKYPIADRLAGNPLFRFMQLSRKMTKESESILDEMVELFM